MLGYFYILWASLILVGCGGVSDRTVVTGVCKSCKPYYVRGSWHYPQNYYEYDEVGLASWYGPGFHGKPKPYGELFDQNALTAAHRTLPLPTIVQVTNLEDGRAVKVLIDDRGPFTYEGRIIDLSLASAKAVGTYSKGLAKVRVHALVEESKALANYLTRYGPAARDPSGRTWWQIYEQEIAGRYGGALCEVPVTSLPLPKTMPKPNKGQNALASSSAPRTMTDLLKMLDAPSAQTAGQPVHPKKTTPHHAAHPWYIEVGGHFVQRENAEKLLKSMHLPYPCQVVEVKHPSGQKFYCLRLGPFSHKKTAEQAVKYLAELGQSGAIITKK